jgi:hypothetical protein
MKNKDIIAKVSKEFGIDITKKTRKREYLYARAVYFKLAQDIFRRSLTSIGKDIGLDHATVLHSINNVYPTIQMFEPGIIKTYNKLYDRIRFENEQQRGLPTTSEEAAKEILDLRYRLSFAEAQARKVISLGPFEDLLCQVPEDKVDLVRVRLDAIIKMLR